MLAIFFWTSPEFACIKAAFAPQNPVVFWKGHGTTTIGTNRADSKAEETLSSTKLRRMMLFSPAIAGLCLCGIVVAKFTGGADEDAGFAPPPVAEAPAETRSMPGEPPQPAEDDAPKTATQTVQVQPGDNLSLVFRRQGLSQQDLHQLVNTQPLGPRLANILPGHEFSFLIGEGNDLLGLTYSSGPLEKLEFVRSGSGFEGTEIVAEPERVQSYKHAVIDHSLFVAGQRAGFTDKMTMKLAEIFQWDVDFVLDIRSGDSFHVLFEENYLDNKFIGFGRILAAEFVNQGRSHQAVLYANPEGNEGYFDLQGNSVQKQFLRAPLKFTRISSNFNLRRKHPLWKRNMPHRGIDYAAPTGTEVLASGDGIVTTAARTAPNGNFVVLRHGSNITTKYLHLSKIGRGVRPGAKVQQGQVIGEVGATGYATGPHLHYEFLVNGVHQNPRTVDLPDAAPIATTDRMHFNATAVPLLASLMHHKQPSLAVGR